MIVEIVVNFTSLGVYSTTTIILTVLVVVVKVKLSKILVNKMIFMINQTYLIIINNLYFLRKIHCKVHNVDTILILSQL